MKLAGAWLMLASFAACGHTERAAPASAPPSSVPSLAGAAGAADGLDDTPRASNGVPLPRRDPRDSCEGIGIAVSKPGEQVTCPTLVCDCSDQPLDTWGGTMGCVTAIDCDALCGLPEGIGFYRLFLCSQKGICERDSDCAALQHCVHAAGETIGICSDRGQSADCFTDQDCSSGACVETGPIYPRWCMTGFTGTPCNRNEQCGLGRCALGEGEYLGACADGKVGSPCVAAADCNAGLECARGALVSAAPAPLGLGACTDGFVGSPCYNAEDCSEGFFCIASARQCSAGGPGALCDSNDECPGGACTSVFSRRQCTTGQEGAPCGDFTACQPGLQCVQNLCRAPQP